MILPKKTTYINGTKMDYLPSGNIEITTDELLTLDAKLGVKLNEGILECVNSSPTLPDQEPYFKNEINVRDIKNDCDLLKTLQDAFPNITFILTTELTPYFSLYKDPDEAFTTTTKFVTSPPISKTEMEEYQNFNLDEKFACFLSDLYHILEEHGCIDKKCVVIYGGSFGFLQTLDLRSFEPKYYNRHHINILEIKL